jgi:hypothetical protein
MNGTTRATAPQLVDITSRNDVLYVLFKASFSIIYNLIKVRYMSVEFFYDTLASINIP